MIKSMTLKVKQLFCRHKNVEWYTVEMPFKLLSGEKRFNACLDCGKEEKEYYHRYDKGMRKHNEIRVDE